MSTKLGCYEKSNISSSMSCFTLNDFIVIILCLRVFMVVSSSTHLPVPGIHVIQSYWKLVWFIGVGLDSKISLSTIPHCQEIICCEIWELHPSLYHVKWYYFTKRPSLFHHMIFKSLICRVLKYSARNFTFMEFSLNLCEPSNLRNEHNKQLLWDFLHIRCQVPRSGNYWQGGFGAWVRWS